MKSILFVCLGNICRSPTAEQVVRQKADAAGCALTLESAGTAGWHVGKPPHPPMIATAGARGYDLSALRARQFAREDFEAFDLIVTMDGDNLRNVEALRPEGSETPVRAFMSYAPQTGIADVPDPYYTDGYEETLELIELAADGLIAELTE